MADFNIDELLSSITSNPELMEKINSIKESNSSGDVSQSLPDIISLLSPIVNSSSRENDTKEEASRADTAEDNAKIPAHIARLSEKINKNSALLLALKPYLKKERRDIIDSVVKMAQVANLMKLAK